MQDLADQLKLLDDIAAAAEAAAAADEVVAAGDADTEGEAGAAVVVDVETQIEAAGEATTDA